VSDDDEVEVYDSAEDADLARSIRPLLDAKRRDKDFQERLDRIQRDHAELLERLRDG
jgi:hypothetical protein